MKKPSTSSLFRWEHQRQRWSLLFCPLQAVIVAVALLSKHVVHENDNKLPSKSPLLIIHFSSTSLLCKITVFVLLQSLENRFYSLMCTHAAIRFAGLQNNQFVLDESYADLQRGGGFWMGVDEIYDITKYVFSLHTKFKSFAFFNEVLSFLQL